MKAIKTKIRYLYIIFFICLFNLSCTDDNNFKVPENLNEQENAMVAQIVKDLENPSSGVREITISNLKQLFVSEKVTEITSDIIVKGYVSSSDFTGNFYKEFFIQDAPDNPSSAIKIATEFVDSYNKFNFGREVYIKLNGLFIGEVRSGDGVIAIGGKRNNSGEVIENLSLNQTENHVFRTTITEEINPLEVTFSQLNLSHIGIYVRVNNAQFPTDLVGKTLVNATDQFDTKHSIESCEGLGYANFIIETSAFAQFKFAPLPTEGGTISGIVSKTFNGSNLVLVLNYLTDINMNNERCTPLNKDEFDVIFSEDFEDTSGVVAIDDWLNYTQSGVKPWRSYLDDDSLSRAVRVGSFKSKSPTISWLITKGINLDATQQEFLSFQTSNSFSDGSNLEVLISTNWDETANGVTKATWVKLPGKIVLDTENFANWVHSGFIDLSAFTGKAHIAFKYSGNDDERFDGTYELDNIVIYAK